jgi:hypothetical protein
MILRGVPPLPCMPLLIRTHLSSSAPAPTPPPTALGSFMPRFGPNVPIPDYRNDQAFTRVHLNQYAGPESDAVATHKSGHGPIRV